MTEFGAIILDKSNFTSLYRWSCHWGRVPPFLAYHPFMCNLDPFHPEKTSDVDVRPFRRLSALPCSTPIVASRSCYRLNNLTWSNLWELSPRDRTWDFISALHSHLNQEV
jgi:hypothetical protein